MKITIDVQGVGDAELDTLRKITADLHSYVESCEHLEIKTYAISIETNYGPTLLSSTKDYEFFTLPEEGS